MNNVLDDRLRALMARVEEMTPPSPEFESLRTRTSVTRTTHLPWARTLIAVAATIVLITGLVVIQARRGDVSPTSQRRLTTHAVATVLPDGWEAKGALEGGDLGPDPSKVNPLQVFATTAAPAGPVVGLLYSGANTMADAATQRNVMLADGRRAAIGESLLGNGRSLDIEASPGTWIGLLANNVSDADLLAIGSRVRVAPDGNGSIIGPLPDDLVPVGSSDLLGGVQTSDFTADRLPSGATMTGYGPIGEAFDTTIIAFTPTLLDRALLGIVGEITAMRSVGAPLSPIDAINFGPRAGVGAYLERDGVAFIARSATRDASQLAGMLDSLQPADNQTWSDLIAQRTVAATTSTGMATADTQAPPPATLVPGTPTPTPVSVDYTITPTADGYQAVAEIPAGQTVMHIRFIGRTTLVEMSLDGKALASETFDGVSGGDASHPKTLGGSSAYLDIVPTTDPAAEFRVTDQDHVYSTKFITIDPRRPMRIAMILVPPLPTRTTHVSAYTYAADGTPLNSFG